MCNLAPRLRACVQLLQPCRGPNAPAAYRFRQSPDALSGNWKRAWRCLAVLWGELVPVRKLRVVEDFCRRVRVRMASSCNLQAAGGGWPKYQIQVQDKVKVVKGRSGCATALGKASIEELKREVSVCEHEPLFSSASGTPLRSPADACVVRA